MLEDIPVMPPKQTRVLYVSDIHCEHWRPKDAHDLIDSIISDCISLDATTLVLAGDIDSFQEIGNTLKHICSSLAPYNIPVVYVPGNHEYYGARIAFNVSNMVSDIQNLYLPELGTVTINGVEFHGITGWIDESYRQIHYPKDSPFHTMMKKHYNDFNYIKDFSDTLAQGKEDKKRLFEGLTNTFLPKIVVTHFMPCVELISTKYLGDKWNKCFCNDWAEEIAETYADYWIYGHTHEQNDQKLNGCSTLFRCNPVGYPHERIGYRPKMIIFD